MSVDMDAGRTASPDPDALPDGHVIVLSRGNTNDVAAVFTTVPAMRRWLRSGGWASGLMYTKRVVRLDPPRLGA